MNVLNAERVKALFMQEAVLIGVTDGVPLYRAEELFGSDAAQFAFASKNSNLFGIGNFDLPYLTYKGFQLAASYCNVKNIYKSLNKEAKTA